jgi:hypothetical protein
MKIIIVHIGDILKYPPVMSLINALEQLKIDTVVVTTKSDFNNMRFENVLFKVLDYEYERNHSPILKMINIIKYRKQISNIIDDEYINNSLIWITYNVSLKHMNIGKLLKHKYVLQLMELSENIRYYRKFPFKMNAPKIAYNAEIVVVPEYNRAHILQAWWDLERLPFILPNKPYCNISIERNSYIQDDKARNVIESLNNKKIILYQGILSKERPLEKLIKVVEDLGDDYAFVVMSDRENIYKNIHSNNFYFIPFVAPPYHLQITSHAYIGILTYVPFKGEFSPLNSLYCAPNKIYEYAKFGIPMMGNDIPGLKFLFSTQHCGICFEDFTEDSMHLAFNEIIRDYENLSKSSYKLYENLNYVEKVEQILEITRMNEN